MKTLLICFMALVTSFNIQAQSPANTTPASTVKADIATPYVTFTTNQGNIVLELNPEKAPISVANFLNYANSGYYNGVIFHRVIKDFMIQTGGFTENMTRKATQEPIKNEADNGLFNNRGSIAMARTGQVDSATSQFFINVKNNYFLNNGYRDFGYAVFGNVISGMEVVDAISQLPTGMVQGMRNVPIEPVIVEKVSVSYSKP
ncbi:peptidylprolyl isomerase A [Oceaniserpentilla sp. 4NH20-0058]|uniref:peptidylprolyl isomerase n=1 Tax=Oceaniserpentilla sp. 4NH20-0058 TaxID=3127660 RepID=UPI00310AE4FA